MRSVAGPGITAAFDAAAAIHAVTNKAANPAYSSKSTGHVALNQAQHLLGSNMPNLFYVKGVYDWLFPYALSEMVNPGARARAEQQMRQQGQHFILHP